MESSALSSLSARNFHLGTNGGLYPDLGMLESSSDRKRVSGYVDRIDTLLGACEQVNEKAGNVGLMMESIRS